MKYHVVVTHAGSVLIFQQSEHNKTKYDMHRCFRRANPDRLWIFIDRIDVSNGWFIDHTVLKTNSKAEATEQALIYACMETI
jgi:hypothetical protein